MIVDTLDNAARYFGLDDRIALALKYLKDNDCTKLAAGKIPIQDDQVFALMQDNTTRPRTHARHLGSASKVHRRAVCRRRCRGDGLCERQDADHKEVVR